MTNQVMSDLQVVRTRDERTEHEVGEALVSLESFVAIALRVFADTNPSKLREHMRIVEMQHYMQPGEKKQ